MPPIPTPEETRRPDVRAYPIVLADGRSWGFLLPSARLKPTVTTTVDGRGRPTVTIGIRTVRAYPPEILRLLERTRVAFAGGSGAERLSALFGLAAALLLATHEISENVAASLLDLGEGLSRFVPALLEVAFGLTTDPDLGPEGGEHA